MPPRRRKTANEFLTPENLATLAAALAEGRRATVYLIEPTPSLGLPEGTSARVVSIDGSTVTISPKGVDDELPFEAEELRITRTVPGAAPKPAAKSASNAQASKPAVAKQEIAEWTEPAPKPAPAKSVPAKSVPAKSVPAKSVPAAKSVPVSSPPPAPKPTAPRKGKKGPDSVSVTIHAGADNDWSVTVTHGARRPGKAQPVSPESVSRAVRELGDESAREAVEAVISHAREEAAFRVAELSRQLEEARSMLAALESDS